MRPHPAAWDKSTWFIVLTYCELSAMPFLHIYLMMTRGKVPRAAD